MADFLLEIGLEEIPARMIAGAEAELGKRVRELLARERLLDDSAAVKTFSTPRRLAVLVEGVRASQADVEEKLTGPSWSVAFKDGGATKAAEAFAKIKYFLIEHHAYVREYGEDMPDVRNWKWPAA